MKFPLSHPRLLGAAALAFALSCVPPVAAEAPATALPGIRASYDGVDAAFHSRDLTRAMSYFTPDYTAFTEKGSRMDREQQRKQYADRMKQMKTWQTHYDIQKLTPLSHGEMLVALQMHCDGTGEKRILFAHVKGTFTNDFRARDLWVNTPDGWRLKSRTVLQDDTRTHPG